MSTKGIDLSQSRRSLDHDDRRRLDGRIASVVRWGIRERVRIKFVSGLMVTRTNPGTGNLEVLLVKGSSNGKPKPFWQFPGGYVAAGEDPVDALHRELKEELGVAIPPTGYFLSDPTSSSGTPVKPGLCYINTYIPKPRPGAEEVLAIHCFWLPGNCPWDMKRGNVRLGSDVNQMAWTDDPLREGGQPRVLTEQTDQVLRNVMKYEGPPNVNTNLDPSYLGSPDRDVPRRAPWSLPSPGA